MPPAIDYRQTFLRHHVPTELDPPFAQESGFREEILALDSLRPRLLQAFPGAGSEIHRLASRRRFFVTMPDVQPWLYLPVRVRSLSEDGKDYADLTDLLCSTTETPRSVLLTARSGAGKSTAMLKAFFDCLVGRDPALGGCLPCYLRQLHSSRDAFSDARGGKSVGHEVILDLLAEASRLPSASAAQLKQWLTCSPPLLLFLDLNATGDDLRPVLAKGIVRFQEYFKGRHRWVVAYRAVYGDATLNYLRQMPWFGTYDLRPLQYEDAFGYLGNVRRLEEDLATELARHHPRASNPPTTTAPTDGAQLRQLFDRYGNDADGLISTPLLMHFVSLIGVERAAGVESLAQLYEEVVKEYLDRDYGRLDDLQSTPYADLVSESGLMTAEGRIKIKVAMARVALAILAAGGGARLARGQLAAEIVLDRLLSDPNKFRQPDWWPADSWWHDGRYFRDSEKNAFNPEARRAIREFSFLRRDVDGFGFLHDSFLYYFAALAVRCKEEPEIDICALDDESVRAEWCRKTVQRMYASPELWRQPALFLGGMLTPAELRDFLPRLLMAESVPGLFGVVFSLVRGRRQLKGFDDVVLRQTERALSLRASELARLPEPLFAHVYNHLAWCEEPLQACRAFADSVLWPRMNATGRPWLRAETPMPPTQVELLRLIDTRGVNCLASLSEGEIISGHGDGTVRKWQPGTIGNHTVLYNIGGFVTCLAVDHCRGLVYSGGGNLGGFVHCWRPGDAEAKILYEHEYNYVECLAVDPRDGSVYSGGSDGNIYCWRPDQGVLKVLDFEYEIRSIAMDTQTGSIVFGAEDGAVRSFRLAEECRVLYCTDHAKITSVAIDVASRCVVSGGKDGTVRRWRFGQANAEILYQHEGGVEAVVLEPNGAIVSGGRDRTVRRWHGGDSVSLYRHEGTVCCLIVDPREGAIVSGGRDGTIRYFPAAQNAATELYRHDHSVSSVAVNVKDGTMFSGGLDGTVRQWNTSDLTSLVLHRHKGRYEYIPQSFKESFIDRKEPVKIEYPDMVTGLAMDCWDGSILLQGIDGVITRLGPGCTDAEILPMAKVAAFCIDPLDRTIITTDGYSFGEVRRWQSPDRNTLLYKQECTEGSILALSVDPVDGTIVSASSFGDVLQWRPEEGERFLYRDEYSQGAVAVDLSAQCVISGGSSANLIVFQQAVKEFVMLLTPYTIRSVSCSLRHNRIAVVLGDGRLVLVRVEPSVEALLSYPGSGKNPSPAASSP